MSLLNYVAKTDTVELPGGTSMVLRGLSLADIVNVTTGRMDEAESLWKSYAGVGNGPDGDKFNIGASAVTVAPSIVALVIAHAAGHAGNDQAVDIAASLPAPIQIEAIEKIARLTLDTSGGPKKVAEMVLRITQAVVGAIRDVRLSAVGPSK